jgi:CDP-diacylglycerol--glycerol-3-phosphate 3-phosphatidyltransferase
MQHDRQLPNKLSLARLFLSALFVADLTFPWAYQATVALGIFAVASITDWLDGWIARTQKLESDLGRLLDPLADKILITAAFIVLLQLGYVPMWIVVAIVAREFLITGLRTLAATRGFVLAAEKAGKHKTLSQILFVVCCLAYQALEEVGAGHTVLAYLLRVSIPPLLWLVLCITIASGLTYLLKNRSLLFAFQEGAPPQEPSKDVPGKDSAVFPAFKEWEAVVRALGTGRQSVILRKGGLTELRRGFQTQHGKFWLLPTRFHQREEKLKPAFRSWVQNASTTRLTLEYVAQVEESSFLTDWDQVLALDDFHIWSTQTIREKFFCGKTPGIHCLLVRVFRVQPPVALSWDPSYDGCRSWIDVPASWEHCQIVPVLEEEEFLQLRERITGLVKA